MTQNDNEVYTEFHKLSRSPNMGVIQKIIPFPEVFPRKNAIFWGLIIEFTTLGTITSQNFMWLTMSMLQINRFIIQSVEFWPDQFRPAIPGMNHGCWYIFYLHLLHDGLWLGQTLVYFPSMEHLSIIIEVTINNSRGPQHRPDSDGERERVVSYWVQPTHG